MSTELPASDSISPDEVSDDSASASKNSLGASGPEVRLAGGNSGSSKETAPLLQRPPFSEPEAEPVEEAAAEPAETETADAPAPNDDEEPTQAPVDLPSDDAAKTETQAPSATLRYATPSELYGHFPEVKTLTLHRPREGETVQAYMYRLRGSTTPEETITFTAFAAQPAMAIWWAYGCLRTMADSLSPEDRGLMELIATWSGNPDNTNRWRVMKSALYAPKLTPVGHLGLAVGWSGGSIAPNDPAPVPAWRTPKSINTAVLSSIAHVSLQERSRSMARFIDLAGKMFDV